jgi:hypothetical protein
MFSSVLALSGRTLGAVEHHILTADNLAHAFYHSGARPVATPFSTLRGKKGSLKDALSAFAMERVSIRVLYKKYELLGKSKRALSTTLRVIQDIEEACSRHVQQALVAINEDAAPAPAGRLTIPLALKRGPDKVAQFLHSNGEALLFKSRPGLRVLAKAAKKIVKPVIYITFFGAAVIFTGLRLSDLVTVGQGDTGEGGEKKITG